MEFAAFADRVETLESEPGDLATVAAVAELLVTADEELPVVTRFLLGRVYPAHDTRTLDVGPALCYEALARAAGTNVTKADVEDRLAETGEIGAVAADLDLGGQQGLAAFAAGAGDGIGAGEGDGLTVTEVDTTLRELAAESGEGSESRKLDTLFGLFNRSSPAEAKVLARLVLGEMRIGVGEGAVRDAVAEAFLADPSAPATSATDEPDTDATLADFGTDAGDGNNADAAVESDDADDEPVTHATDEAIAAVERALQVTNDYGRVAALAREAGAAGLAEERLRVGRPVQAMLAQAGTAADAVESFGTVAVETKFDGARVQIHYDPAGASTTDGEPLAPEVYSRNMDDVTGALPEVVEYVEEHVDAPVILDGEVVAVDDDGDPLPFQEVLRRFRRKHDVDRMREEVSLELHAFDCLHADGDDLLDAPLRERHDRLADLLPDAAAEVTLVDSVDAVERIETEALEAGHEGIMLKDPDSPYTPGDRGAAWLKRKPDVETLDAVIVGAEWGEGRRAELFGTFLLAVRDGDDFVTIGKVATGLTDEELAALTERLEPHVIGESGTEISVRPAVVLEVGYEEIQRSPTYASGYALRFPRFLGVREDKDPADADTLDRIERLTGESSAADEPATDGRAADDPATDDR
ncbi:ATP-dependent DNA ligase LigA [Halorubrum gandharaense]